MAGVGDALAIHYEAAACNAANKITMTGGYSTLGGMALTLFCCETLFADALKAKAACELDVTTKALEHITEAISYLTSIGFGTGGLTCAHATHDGLTALPQTARADWSAASAATHDGLTTLPQTHKLLHGEKTVFGVITQLGLHGEKTVFGVITQLVLQNEPTDELVRGICFLKDCDLPTTFADLNLADVSDEELLIVAEAACSPEDTIGNMPFEVTQKRVVAAMKQQVILPGMSRYVMVAGDRSLNLRSTHESLVRSYRVRFV